MHSTQHTREFTQLPRTNNLTLPSPSYNDSYLCTEPPLESQENRLPKSPSTQHQPLHSPANRSHRRSDRHNDGAAFEAYPTHEPPSHQPLPIKTTSSSYATPFDTVDIVICEMRERMERNSHQGTNRRSNWIVQDGQHTMERSVFNQQDSYTLHSHFSFSSSTSIPHTLSPHPHDLSLFRRYKNNRSVQWATWRRTEEERGKEEEDVHLDGEGEREEKDPEEPVLVGEEETGDEGEEGDTWRGREEA